MKKKNSRITEIIKTHVMRKLYPSRETEQAILRLEHGIGIKMDMKGFTDMLIRVWPQFKDYLLDKVSLITGNEIKVKTILCDLFFEKKLEYLSRQHSKLTKEKVFVFKENVNKLARGKGLKTKFRNHSLRKVAGKKNLEGYWSFVAYYDTSNIQDNQKRTIVCLYKPKTNILYLANIGVHDRVYARGPISGKYIQYNGHVLLIKGKKYDR